jgi:hypothetical protein
MAQRVREIFSPSIYETVLQLRKRRLFPELNRTVAFALRATPTAKRVVLVKKLHIWAYGIKIVKRKYHRQTCKLANLRKIYALPSKMPYVN